MRAASRTLGLSLGFCVAIAAAFLPFGCAGGNKPMAIPGSTINDDAAGNREQETDAALSDGSSADLTDAGVVDGGPNQAQSAPPVVDPAVSHALLAKTGDTTGAAALGLRFEVIELGADLPWAFAVVNRGTEAAVVDFDARLLTLEIQPPTPPAKTDAKGKPLKAPKKPKPVLCRLPGDVVPHSVDAALAIKLEPGEGLVQNFDPRLYCIGKAPWPLVEGAEVSARLGWAPKMKVSWSGGKREEKPGLQSEPFVAEPSEAEGSLPKSDKAELADAGERRVKELAGTPLTLGSNFAAESELPPGVAPPAPGLELTIAGGDASNESTATATSTITNRGKHKQDLYFRRELVTYEVSGPDGVFQCDPEPDQRSPADRSSVQTLGVGGRFSAVSRLIEMCPAHAFARPGLYLVHARFDAADPATDLGFKGFMGRLVSKKPALVRVRQGELPFTPASGMMRVHVGE